MNYVFQLPNGEVVDLKEFLLQAETLLAEHGYYFAEDIEDLPEVNNG